MTALRLVEDDNVVELRPLSTFNEAWEAREGQMRKRGDGREKTRKLWEKAEKRVGPVQLLAALKRYLREEKEPTCGRPGLSVWLNGERWDHWLQATEGQTSHGLSRALFPEPFRAALCALTDESWVRSYIDQCSLADGSVLVVPAGKKTAWDRIGEKAREMKEAGLTARRWGE